MPEWEGWSTEQVKVDQTRVLARLLASATPDGRSTQTPLEVIADLGPTTVNAHRFADDLQFVHHLVAVGYANGGGRETQSVKFNEAGIRLAEEFRRAGERRRRAPACRRALLGWLYDHDAGDPFLKLSDMTSDPHSWFYGSQFTAQEIGAAGDNLAERRYVEVLTIEELGAFRAKLTAPGRACVERHDGDPDRADAGTPSGGIHIGTVNHQGDNLAIGTAGPLSQTSTSQVIMGQSATEVLQILRELTVRGAIPTDEQQQAQELAADLQAATGGQPPAGLWQRVDAFFQNLNARANQNPAATLLIVTALNVAAMRAGLAG